MWRWRPEQPTAGVVLRLAELPWVGPALWRRSPRRAPPKGGELQVRVSSANAHSAQSSGTNHLAGISDQPPRTVLPCRPPSVPSSAPDPPPAGVFLCLEEQPGVGPSLSRRSPLRAPPKGGELQVRGSCARIHSTHSGGTSRIAGALHQPPAAALPCDPQRVPPFGPKPASRGVLHCLEEQP